MLQKLELFLKIFIFDIYEMFTVFCTTSEKKRIFSINKSEATKNF